MPTAINLAQWKSLGLVLNGSKVWFSYKAENDKLEEINTKKLKQVSIKNQIKFILTMYGWIPNELNYQNIRLNMTMDQIKKHGDNIQLFINKYNEIIKNMKLPINKQMPQNTKLSDIISFSHFINQTSSHSIKQLLNSLDNNSLKQILITYLEYFMNDYQIKKSLNNNKSESHSHHLILRTIQNKLTKKLKKKVQISSNPFDKLPLMLRSYILSFCDYNCMNNASYCCHVLYKASKEPIARYEMKINASKLSRMDKLSQFELVKYNKPLIHLVDLHKGRKLKYGSRFKQIMESCNKLQSLKMDNYYHWRGKLAVKTLDFLCSSNNNNNISNLEFIGKMDGLSIANDFLFKLNKLTFIKSMYGWYARPRESLKCIQNLWIRNESYPLPISIENGDISIKKYINSAESKLKYLKIESYDDLKCDNTATPNPLFWLWNIPNLEVADLLFPKSVLLQNELKDEFNKILSSSIIRQKARNQMSFKTLILKLSNMNDSQHVFELIPSVYVNLQYIEYHEFASTNILYEPLDWKLCFGNLKSIKFNIQISINNVINLFETIIANSTKNNNSFKNMEVLHLCNIVSVHSYKDIEHFVDKIGVFLNKRPVHLNSFSINFYKHKLFLKDDKLKKNLQQESMIFNKYLTIILKMIENDDIFDGYLSLQIPFNKLRNNALWRFIEWTKENIQESLKISQIITKIQTKINQKNIKNNEKKTIINLMGISLTDEHNQFLKFWFNDNTDLFDCSNHCIRFVAY